MVKYKLIKEYPGSPKLNTIRNWDSNAWSDNNDFCENKMFNPSKYPEYWEEVIEKNYEILSFKQDSKTPYLWTNFGINPDCWCKNKNNFAVTSGYTLEQILNNPLYSIHSVKRLSDGEIFTIGDTIEFNKHNSFKKYRPKGVISEFKVYRDTLCFIDNNLKYNAELGIIGNKLKSVFRTEDGVKIYENDKGEISYWELLIPNRNTLKSNEWRISNAPVVLKNIIPTPSDDLKNVGVLRFSTKEAAREYVLINKPCLSLKDVSKFYKGTLNGKNGNSRGIIELAKSKL